MRRLSCALVPVVLAWAASCVPTSDEPADTSSSDASSSETGSHEDSGSGIDGSDAEAPGSDASSDADGDVPDATAPDGLSLVAGAGSFAGRIDDIGTDARLSAPFDLVVDSVHDTIIFLNSFRRFDVATSQLSSLVTLPAYATRGVDGVAGVGSPESETAGVFDASTDTIYLASTNRVRTFNVDNGAFGTLFGSSSDARDVDGPLASARLLAPSAVAVDATRHLLYVRGAHCVIRVVDLRAGTVSTPWGNASQCTITDGSKSTARFGEDLTAGGLVFDGNHTLYLVNTGVIRVIDTTTGTVSTPTITGPTTSGFSRLTYDSATNTLYAMPNTPGSTTIVAIKVSDWTATNIAAPALTKASVFVPSKNQLFVATYSALMAGGATGFTTVAGAVTTLQGSADGIGPDARFSAPSALSYDSTKRIAYVLDSGNRTIRKVDVTTGSVALLAGYPGAIGTADGAFGTSNFENPVGCASSEDGNTLYVADGHKMGGTYGLLRSVDVATGSISTLVGYRTPSAAIADGPPVKARLGLPTSLALDQVGKKIYFVDGGGFSQGGLVRMFDLQTSEVSTIAGSQYLGGGAVDGPGTSARFLGISALAYDVATHTLFAADGTGASRPGEQGYFDSSLVRAIDVTNGMVSTIAGTFDTVTPGTQVDGGRSDARLNRIDGAIVDAARGVLYVSDTGAIRRVVPATGEVTTFVGASDRRGLRLGPFTKASLSAPSGLALVGDGDMLLTDRPENVLLRAKGF